MKKIYIIFAMAFAQLMQSQTVPQAFNYQGIARDAQGVSMPSKQLGIKITLQEKSGNTTTDVYAETHTVTTSSTGLFNIAIGRGTASIGTFSNVNFSNKNISVKTEIDPNGGTSYSLSGTSELLSVPYALVAGNSTTNPSPDVWTKDNSNNNVYLNKGEKVGIGTETPTTYLDINQNATGANRGFLNLSNTSTASDGAVWMGLKAGNGSNSGLSIGHHSSNYTATPNHSDVSIIESGGNGLALKSNNTSGFISLLTGGNTFDNFERMRITSDGKVGIGTAKPETILHVSGDKGNNSYSIIESTSLSDDASAGHIIKVGGKRIGDIRGTGYSYFPSLYPGYLIVNGVANGIMLKAWNSTEAKRGDIKFQTGSLSLDTAPIDRAIITGDGNLGVGTTTPTSKVQVSNGDVYIDNPAYGVIMKSPNGQCWRVTVENTGTFKSTAIDCISISDRSGNTYKTVTIGSQTWFAENLKTTVYNDGTSINNGVQNWNAPVASYMWYNNDKTTYGNTYGALYNWYAVDSKKLCPIGWHVPTSADWLTLTNQFGDTTTAGANLKEAGLSHWQSTTPNTNNSSGFTGLPAGYSDSFGTSKYIYTNAFFWTSDAHSNPDRAMRTSLFLTDAVTLWDLPKNYGFSVRCVKD